MDKHAQDRNDPEPEPSASRIVIRPTGRVWSLEDETRQVGGLFTTLDAALAFARTEQLHGAGAIRIVVGGEASARRLRAA